MDYCTCMWFWLDWIMIQITISKYEYSVRKVWKNGKEQFLAPYKIKMDWSYRCKYVLMPMNSQLPCGVPCLLILLKYFDIVITIYNHHHHHHPSLIALLFWCSQTGPLSCCQVPIASVLIFNCLLSQPSPEEAAHGLGAPCIEAN